jgi:hypothetical protein
MNSIIEHEIVVGRRGPRGVGPEARLASRANVSPQRLWRDVCEALRGPSCGETAGIRLLSRP